MLKTKYRGQIAAILICLLLISLFSGGAALAQWDRGVPGPFEPFIKTVSTSPGVCSNDSSIAVPTGTTVYYCYHLFDPPPFAYNYSITDDILGFIASGTVAADDSTIEIASSPIFVDTTNVGMFEVVSIDNTTQERGGVFLFNSTADVFIDNSSGGGGQFDAAIPTLSEYSLFAFGALLLIGAAITLRRAS